MTRKKKNLVSTIRATSTQQARFRSAYSSARDVALLASHLVEDPNIHAIAQLKELEITSQSGQNTKLKSTNILLGELGIKGLKTGTTSLAGEYLGFAKKQVDHIVTVILGSKVAFPILALYRMDL